MIVHPGDACPECGAGLVWDPYTSVPNVFCPACGFDAKEYRRIHVEVEIDEHHLRGTQESV